MEQTLIQIRQQMEHIGRMNRGIEQERASLLQQNKLLEEKIRINGLSLRELGATHTKNTEDYIKLSKELSDLKTVTA